MKKYSQLKEAFKFCHLLKVKAIYDEVIDYLKNSTLHEISKEKETIVYQFIDANHHKIILKLFWNYIEIIGYYGVKEERIYFDDSPSMVKKMMENRLHGFLYTVLQKHFAPSSHFYDEVVLVDLIEERYSFRTNSLEQLYPGVNFEEMSLERIMFWLNTLEANHPLKNDCDVYSIFETRMDYYLNWEGRMLKPSGHSTKTIVNGEDVSHFYDGIEGPDKLYRIFDLYHGFLRARNTPELQAMRLGLVSLGAYDLKGNKGITASEDLILGVSPFSVDKETEETIRNVFGLKGDITKNVISHYITSLQESTSITKGSYIKKMPQNNYQVKQKNCGEE